MKNNTEKFTQYNSATKSLSENIVCALEGIDKYNYQMVIKYLPNKEQQNPAKEVNKDLNDPFNWKCTSQFHRSPEELKAALERAANDTERDLIKNWVWIFGEPKAIELYKNTRKCTKGLFNGIGTCSQVRIKDMVKYLRENGENERADLWEKEDQYFNSGLWSPKGVEYYQPMEGNTYAVYFRNNEEGLNKDELKAMLDNSIMDVMNQLKNTK